MAPVLPMAITPVIFEMLHQGILAIDAMAGATSAGAASAVTGTSGVGSAAGVLAVVGVAGVAAAAGGGGGDDGDSEAVEPTEPEINTETLVGEWDVTDVDKPSDEYAAGRGPQGRRHLRPDRDRHRQHLQQQRQLDL